MRWVKKYDRIVKTFALFPIRIHMEWRWLEMVYIKQHRHWGNGDFWIDDEFTTKEEYKEWRRECREKKMQSEA